CGVEIKNPFSFEVVPDAEEIIEEANGKEPEKPQGTAVESMKFTIGGLRFCLTGAMSEPRREIEKRVIEAGGIVGGISMKTDYLVVGDNPGSKLAKAKSYNIKIINESELMDKGRIQA
ncbi:unnamed protein product, partial [marine sediment metagenome]